MKTRDRWYLACVALACLWISGCGGGSNGITTPTVLTPTPNPAPATTPITQGTITGLGVLTLTQIPFTTTAAGSITATVDWTFATDNVDIYLVRGTCTIDQFNNGTCPFISFSESPNRKPEVTVAPIQTPGSFTLYVGNRGPQTESLSYQLTLTTS